MQNIFIYLFNYIQSINMQPIKILLCGIQALLTLFVLLKTYSFWAELTFVAVDLLRSLVRDRQMKTWTLIDTKLCSFFSADLIASPRSQEDEAHNVQAVIDSLALDYLQVSLSHITGWYILNHQIILHFTTVSSQAEPQTFLAK